MCSKTGTMREGGTFGEAHVLGTSINTLLDQDQGVAIGIRQIVKDLECQLKYFFPEVIEKLLETK